MTYISAGTLSGVYIASAPANPPSVAPVGEGRIYFDGTQFQVSQNGSPFSPVATTAVKAVSTTTTAIDATATTWPFDTSSSGFTATLPTAVGISGRVYNLKKISSDGNTLTIATTGGQTIDGTTTKTITSQWATITVQSNGTNWFVI